MRDTAGFESISFRSRHSLEYRVSWEKLEADIAHQRSERLSGASDTIGFFNIRKIIRDFFLVNFFSPIQRHLSRKWLRSGRERNWNVKSGGAPRRGFVYSACVGTRWPEADGSTANVSGIGMWKAMATAGRPNSKRPNNRYGMPGGLAVTLRGGGGWLLSRRGIQNTHRDPARRVKKNRPSR
jgi:hypothetical protein